MILYIKLHHELQPLYLRSPPDSHAPWWLLSAPQSGTTPRYGIFTPFDSDQVLSLMGFWWEIHGILQGNLLFFTGILEDFMRLNLRLFNEFSYDMGMSDPNDLIIVWDSMRYLYNLCGCEHDLLGNHKGFCQLRWGWDWRSLESIANITWDVRLRILQNGNFDGFPCPDTFW